MLLGKTNDFFYQKNVLDNMINRLLQDFVSKSQLYKDTYSPSFYRIQHTDENIKLTELLKDEPHIQVFDTIKNQLGDLIKGLNPSVIFNAENLNQAIEKHLNGVNIQQYGVWVYYPWLEKLVHILDEEEYVTVRTNRNKHKITAKEQAILADKKIGVIGLSVGQSVSLTLAIERGCGEIRIADYDVLDLTNLNRIRSGVHNVSIKKTVIVAREIAEIDPFLKVTCFHEGITEANIDAFLTENGKLDLLIDECDSFDIKISARKKAKGLQIPVLMEGSDRCTIDIERFDLDPNRPVLHGFVENLDMDAFKLLKTIDERIPYIAPVTGVETLSPRMKASAMEIMSSISTWPQLASAVTYGGGISADISRKILLGHLKVSGRFFIDIDDLINDGLQDENSGEIKAALVPFDVEAYLKANRLEHDLKSEPISPMVLEELIKAANQAPSGGNNQPWLWHYHNNTLHLFLNRTVSGSYLDPDYISSYISIGAAIENLLLSASIHGLAVQWSFTPELLPQHVAFFHFSTGHTPSPVEELLASQIPLRHTNRKIGRQQEINAEDLKQISEIIAQASDTSLRWLSDPAKLIALGEIAGDADLLRMFIPEAHHDFIEKEMRWDLEETNRTGDGIGIHSLDLSNNDQIGLRLMRDKKAISFLKSIEGGAALKRLALRQFENSSAVGLLTQNGTAPLNFLKCGIDMEKTWLMASQLGYQIHPINVPLIFFYKYNFEQDSDLSAEAKLKISILYKKFKEIFELTDDIAEIFLFRIFKAESSPIRTIRRPFNQTLSFGTAKT